MKATMPTDLKSCLSWINSTYDYEDLQFIWTVRPVIAMHSNVGRDIRNRLGLWEENSPLLAYFAEVYGLTHPDNVSNFILETYCARVDKLFSELDPSHESAHG